MAGQVYLVTAVAVAREQLFADFFAARSVIYELAAADADTLAYVLMPDHLHWMLGLRGTSLSRVLQRVKSRSAIAVNRRLSRVGAVWQPGYHDRALRKDEDIRDAARYVVANPLRAGLVDDILDYPLWDAVWM
jgi:REP element-mobilizing transposase RayT